MKITTREKRRHAAGREKNKSFVTNPKKISYGSQRIRGENDCQISQNYIVHVNFQNFTCVCTVLVRFDIHFLGGPCEVVFGVITDD